MSAPQPLARPNGQALCGAKSRTHGRPCQQPAMANGRCRLHGGLTPKGLAHPRTGTGRNLDRSILRKDPLLPHRMVEAYQAAVRDPDLLSTRRDIGLVYARLEDLLARVDTGEAGAMWLKAQALYRTMTTSQDDEARKAAIVDLGALLARGVEDGEAWDQVFGAVDLARRLKADERRRLVDLQAIVGLEEAMGWMGAFVNSVKSRIEDEKIERKDLMGYVARDMDVFMGSSRRRTLEREQEEEQDE